MKFCIFITYCEVLNTRTLVQGVPLWIDKDRPSLLGPDFRYSGPILIMNPRNLEGTVVQEFRISVIYPNHLGIAWNIQPPINNLKANVITNLDSVNFIYVGEISIKLNSATKPYLDLINLNCFQVSGNGWFGFIEHRKSGFFVKKDHFFLVALSTVKEARVDLGEVDCPLFDHEGVEQKVIGPIQHLGDNLVKR